MATISYILKDLDEIIRIINKPNNISIATTIISLFSVFANIYITYDIYNKKKKSIEKTLLNNIKKILNTIINDYEKYNNCDVSMLDKKYDLEDWRMEMYGLAYYMKLYDDGISKQLYQIAEAEKFSDIFEYADLAKNILAKLESYRGV